MAKPEKFVFVCVNRRPEGHPKGSCSQKGGGEVLMEFADALGKEGLLGKVQLIQTGCLGPCFEGPVVSVFPENVWYRMLRPKDVETVVKEHLAGGRPVDKLRLKDEDWE